MTANRLDEFIKNPKKSMWKLAIPIAIAMVVQVSYNIVDTAYVGRLGNEAIAGLTFAFPVFFFLMSLNSGIAVGMASLISRYLGAKKKEKAENAAMHGFIITLVAGLIIFVIGLLTLKPLFVLFGATGITLQYSIDYMFIILLGIFFMFPVFTMFQFFSSQGDTKTPMIIQIVALVCNIILDPIFIFVLDMGVKGAAIATVISFAIGLALNVYYLRKRSHIKLDFKKFRYSKEITKEILMIGAPSSFMMIIISLYIVFLNKVMVSFGIDYVAAFGIATRLESVAILPIVALSLALMPLVGMYFGAKKYSLTRRITAYGIKVGILTTSVAALIFFFFAPIFLRVFTSDINLIKIGSAYLRIDILTFPLMAIGMIISRVLQAMGYGFPGFLIAIVRVFIVAIPLAYLSVYYLNLGFLSVAFAMVMGGMVSCALGIYLLNKRFDSADELIKKPVPA